MADIWSRCSGQEHIRTLDTLAFRIVESQEKVATMTLVDNAEEQMLLEAILEDNKPPAVDDPDAHHYLITTPFRYPPLRHGSRFGLRTRPGLFYASLETRTALAECAYYRFVFWQGMSEPPPNPRIMTDHTTFAVTVKTDKGLYLEQPPFTEFKEDISNPAHYQSSQALGEAMRGANVEAFIYPSARDNQDGANIGIYTLAAIKSKRPLRKQLWSCITSADQVSFIRLHSKNDPFNFPLQQFLTNKVLPMPSC